MNQETGQIINATAEEIKLLNELEAKKVELETAVSTSEENQKLTVAQKWKSIPIGEEIDIGGLKFIIKCVRVDTQEVILSPVGLKFKLKP